MGKYRKGFALYHIGQIFTDIMKLRNQKVCKQRVVRELLWKVVQLSIPTLLAEISSIAMQYIDAAMAGSLGADATGAIGIVTSTTWLFGGLCIAMATGFSVQVAHLTGAGRDSDARNVLRQALLCTLVFGIALSAVGIGISRYLPVWLGGEEDICRDASRYFLIYACALPATQIRQTAGSMLQCSGDMRIPGRLNILMCFLDVILNGLLIFPTRQIVVLNYSFTIAGAGLGVMGAALGTALSEVITALLMLYAVCFRSARLRLERKGTWRLDVKCLYTALRLALPMAFEHIILCGAQIAGTRIVSPLGTVSVAANSLAVTAESFCYMPGYGISAAATTLVGQSIGAGKPQLAKSYARLSVALGAAVMSFTGGVMFFCAPVMFSILTPDLGIRELGTKVLRIEVFAEPLYAASIVAAGALRGAGDTFVPSILNLASMWGIRITCAAFLAPRLGLVGVWIAMCGELCVRGVLFLIRLLRGDWLNREYIGQKVDRNHPEGGKMDE